MTQRSTASRRLSERNQTYSIKSTNLTSMHIDVNTDFDPSSGDWSLFLYMKFDRAPYQFTPANDHNIYSQQNGTGQGRSWLFLDRTNGNKLATFFGGSGTVFNHVVDQGAWHLYTVVYVKASNSLSLYVDGSLKSTVNPPNIESANGVHVLCNNKINTGGIYGNICGAYLITKACTAAQIQDEYFSGDHAQLSQFVNYGLPFSDGSGTKITDTSGNGRHGTLTGGTWVTDTMFKLRPTNVVTKSPQTAQQRMIRKNGNYSFKSVATGLIAANDYVTITGETTDPATTDWTVSLWYFCSRLPTEVSAIPRAQNIYNQLDGTGTGLTWLLIRNSNNCLSTLLDGTGTARQFSYFMSHGWHYIHLTYNKTTHDVKCYVNGIAVGVQNINIAAGATGSHRLMANKVPQGPADGNVAEARFYTREFSATDVANDYYGDKRSADSLRYELLFNDGSGPTVVDSSGNGRNGTITAGSWTTFTPS